MTIKVLLKKATQSLAPTVALLVLWAPLVQRTFGFDV